MCLHAAGLGSRSFRTEVEVTPREKAGQVAVFIAVFTGLPPNRKSLSLFVCVFFLMHLCNSPKSLMKKFSFASKRELLLMKEAIKVYLISESSAHI